MGMKFFFLFSLTRLTISFLILTDSYLSSASLFAICGAILQTNLVTSKNRFGKFHIILHIRTMKREIKFRAWNPEKSKFEFWVIAHSHSILTSLPIPSMG